MVEHLHRTTYENAHGLIAPRIVNQFGILDIVMDEIEEKQSRDCKLVAIIWLIDLQWGSKGVYMYIFSCFARAKFRCIFHGNFGRPPCVESKRS